MDEQSFTSTRFTDYTKITKNNKSPIFGNGSMRDRFLIDQTASMVFEYICIQDFGILFYSLFFKKFYFSINYFK